MTPQEILAKLRAYDRLELPAGESRRAAVLVPLRPSVRAGGLEVVLTRRADTVSHHRGQVAFPGGLIEASDADVQAAALREAHEELALPPSRVELLGRLDDLITGTGFHIAPVVGLVAPDVALVPSVDEVARVFAVPLADLMRAEAWSRRVHERAGSRYVLWHTVHDGEEVWGATAAILHGMLRLLGALPELG